MAADGDALRRWSQHHDGYDVDRSRMVRGWLRAMHGLAAPIAKAGIPPSALTLAGVGSAVAAVRTATSRTPARLAAGLVLVTAVCDGLDGAVALQRTGSGRPVSEHGAIIDHTADRITDVLFAVALRRAGAPRRAAIGAGMATLGYEGIRSALRRAGRVEPVVTVGERPIRVAVVSTALMAAPAVGAAIVCAMSAGACVQMVRRAGE